MGSTLGTDTSKGVRAAAWSGDKEVELWCSHNRGLSQSQGGSGLEMAL